MDIEEILNGKTAADIITALSEKSVEVPEWGHLVKQYEPTLHEITSDHITRRDKTGPNGGVEKASRIYVGLEKLLVKRISEFMFAIPVKRVYHNIDGNETRQAIAKAIESIYKYARIDTINLKRAHNYFASCEVLTIWYAQQNPNSLYGFNSQTKLRCRTYSPMDGVKLYALIDEYGDMLAQSFKYTRKVKDSKVTIYETYTATRHFKWRMEGNGEWKTEIDGEPIAILKIPCIYTWRPEPIYSGLSYLRKEIEYTLSRNSDVIAYNSAPVLKVAGQVVGKEQKGETQRVFRVEQGGDISYVSWAQSIEALKFHVDMLLRLFWTQAQMPDISFDRMASLGSIGYDARQTLLTDAHLKIGDESGAWIESLERECNVIKAFLKQMNTAWASEIDNVEVEHIITPFIQDDEGASIDRLVKANGGKAIMSQLESISNAGYSSDPQATLAQIRKEESEEAANKLSHEDVFSGAE